MSTIKVHYDDATVQRAAKSVLEADEETVEALAQVLHDLRPILHPLAECKVAERFRREAETVLDHLRDRAVSS